MSHCFANQHSTVTVSLGWLPSFNKHQSCYKISSHDNNSFGSMIDCTTLGLPYDMVEMKFRLSKAEHWHHLSEGSPYKLIPNLMSFWRQLSSLLLLTKWFITSYYQTSFCIFYYKNVLSVYFTESLLSSPCF